MTDNSIITTTSVANSSSGIFETPQKITKRDVAVFGTLLMKCRSLDVRAQRVK